MRKSFLVTDDAIVVTESPSWLWLYGITILVIVVDLLFGVIAAAIFATMGYLTLWKLVKTQMKDQSRLLKARKTLKVISLRKIPWSKVRTIAIRGKQVTLFTQDQGRQKFTLDDPDVVDSAIRFLNVKLGERLLILNPQLGVHGGTGFKFDTSSLLKLAAVVSIVISLFGFALIFVYTTVIFPAFLAAGGLLAALDFTVVYGMRNPLLLSPAFRKMGYLGLAMSNVSVPAFFSQLVFGWSEIYSVIELIMLLSISLIVVVAMKIFRG